MANRIYLALGDSITAGEGTTHPMSPYPVRLFQHLRHQGLVDKLIVIAQSGWTSGQLLGAMVRFPESLWPDVKVATLCIGGNNLKQLVRRYLFSPRSVEQLSLSDIQQAIADTSFRLHEICHMLDQRNVRYVRLATLYNPVPQSHLAKIAFRQFNEMTVACANRYGFEVVDLYRPFIGREAHCIDGYKQGRLTDIILPFRRPIHPNDEGHKIITEQFIKTFSKKPVKSPTQPLRKSKPSLNSVKNRKTSHPTQERM